MLQYGGANVTAGEFGAWTLIGAEATAGGYEVAWKVSGQDTYTVWNTDGGGNFTSSAIGAVAGASSALESLETSFQQDLNGDGTIGIPQITIESFGATSLVAIGNAYEINPVGGGTGPMLQYGGANITAGEFGAWTLIGAEATAGGYEVAWKVSGQDTYTVWNTDSSGNFASSAIGAVAGASSTLESLETSFQQDLNGDGTIGIPAGGHAAPSLSGGLSLAAHGGAEAVVIGVAALSPGDHEHV